MYNDINAFTSDGTTKACSKIKILENNYVEIYIFDSPGINEYLT